MVACRRCVGDRACGRGYGALGGHIRLPSRERRHEAPIRTAATADVNVARASLRESVPAITGTVRGRGLSVRRSKVRPRPLLPRPIRRRCSVKTRLYQLPHQVFLTRTETSPATSLEARFGHADFLVLRLVDLLDPSRRDPVSPDAFQYQLAASARLVRELEHEGFEVPYLLSLIDELPLAFETKEPWRLWTSLCCLSINLQARERWEEASDVLETTWHLVDADWPEGESLDVALRLGEHYVRIDQSADAARLY